VEVAQNVDRLFEK